MWNTFVELSKDQLRQIARRQRLAIICILIHMAVYGIAFLGGGGSQLLENPESASLPVKIVIGIGLVLMAAFTIIICMLGASVFGGPPGVLLGLLTLVPLLGIIALLAINTRATALLRIYGIRVGFFGADREDLQSL